MHTRERWPAGGCPPRGPTPAHGCDRCYPAPAAAAAGPGTPVQPRGRVGRTGTVPPPVAPGMPPARLRVLISPPARVAQLRITWWRLLN
eukprot:109383-Chlamydomonas_euryale.AAC.5